MASALGEAARLRAAVASTIVGAIGSANRTNLRKFVVCITGARCHRARGEDEGAGVLPVQRPLAIARARGHRQCRARSHKECREHRRAQGCHVQRQGSLPQGARGEGARRGQHAQGRSAQSESPKPRSARRSVVLKGCIARHEGSEPRGAPGAPACRGLQCRAPGRDATEGARSTNVLGDGSVQCESPQGARGEEGAGGCSAEHKSPKPQGARGVPACIRL